MTGLINSPLSNSDAILGSTQGLIKRTSPEYVKTRAMLREVFESDFDVLCGFTTQLLIENIDLKQRQEVSRNLSQYLSELHLNTGKLSNEMRKHFEKTRLSFGADHPISLTILAFIAGVNRSKESQGRKGGNQRAKKYKSIEAFAVALFDARKWKSIKQAKDQLWPQVKAKSKELSCAMTDETGPETLYKWLLAHAKK